MLAKLVEFMKSIWLRCDCALQYSGDFDVVIDAQKIDRERGRFTVLG